MPVRLLDVNVLVALLDSAHVHHATAVRWFGKNAARSGWATCPLTENGFVRVVTQVNYPNLKLTPAAAARSLAQFKAAFSGVHRFWPNVVTLTDNALFDLSEIAGARQITDAYLAATAQSNGGVLVTFDASIPWRAVRGSRPALIERLIP